MLTKKGSAHKTEHFL